MENNMYSKINTWNKVCKKLNEDPKALPIVSNLIKEDKKNTIATFMARKIAKAVNMIDVENGETNEPEYLPYFNKSPFSFLFTHYGAWHSTVHTSVRLCFRTRRGAEYAVKTFTKVYKDMILD